MPAEPYTASIQIDAAPERVYRTSRGRRRSCAGWATTPPSTPRTTSSTTPTTLQRRDQKTRLDTVQRDRRSHCRRARIRLPRDRRGGGQEQPAHADVLEPRRPLQPRRDAATGRRAHARHVAGHGRRTPDASFPAALGFATGLAPPPGRSPRTTRRPLRGYVAFVSEREPRKVGRGSGWRWRQRSATPLVALCDSELRAGRRRAPAAAQRPREKRGVLPPSLPLFVQRDSERRIAAGAADCLPSTSRSALYPRAPCRSRWTGSVPAWSRTASSEVA
jgi:hypothetical protein